MIQHLEDVKKLLKRIQNNVCDSSASHGDKVYIQELIQLAEEKLDIVLGDKYVENSD